jgi:hypothetical protein
MATGPAANDSIPMKISQKSDWLPSGNSDYLALLPDDPDSGGSKHMGHL